MKPVPPTSTLGKKTGHGSDDFEGGFADPESATAAAAGKRKRLWGEDDAEELEADAEKEHKREARKRARRANKRQKSEAAAQELEKLAGEAQIIIALDMSTSPGMAIVDRSDEKQIRYDLVGFAQTDKQQREFDAVSKEHKTPGRLSCNILSGCLATLWISRAPKDGTYMNNTDYYEQITATLLQRIRHVLHRHQPLPRQPNPQLKLLAVVEAYAFHIIRSSSITGLAELGGAMRNKLFTAGIPFVEVSPTSIKKWFTGKGTADKPEMWKHFEKLVPELKLKEWLPAAFSPDKIPSPHQDIVDAFASAHSLHENHPN